MLFLKSSFLLLISFAAFGTSFNSQQCVQANFQTAITHEGRFFGLVKNDLSLKKEQCLIQVKYKNILETEWEIDICREPIHMKVTSKGSQSVYKRNDGCDDKESSYCRYLVDLMEVIQDHGLIFAKGDREDLTASHGQTYCSYLLLKRHLEEGKLFSKYSANGDIFKASKNRGPQLKSVKSYEPAPTPMPETQPESNENFDDKASEILEGETTSSSSQKGFAPVVDEEQEISSDEIRF